jgi:hypothetical protein
MVTFFCQDLPKHFLSLDTELKNRVRALSVVLLLALVISYVACHSENTVSDRIDAEVRKSGRLNLTTVVDFEWDSVYVFGPYWSREKICEKLSASWATCEAVVPFSLGESGYLFAYMKEGRYLKYEWHMAWNGGFCDSVLGERIAKADAIFRATPSYKTLFGTQVFELCAAQDGLKVR